jgi:hypothetical protein
VIGRKPGEQPHHFDVAASFTLEPAARMHTVEITINVELQERGRMIRRPTCAGRLNATEPKFSQIEGRNEGVDHANRIVI